MTGQLTAAEYIGLVQIAAQAGNGNEEEIQHAFCLGCNPIPKTGIPALCGSLRTHSRPYRPIPDDEHLCVVCDDLADIPCQKCGKP